METRSLRDLQEEIGKWADKNFKDRFTYQPLLGAVEEIGELAHAYLKQDQGIRTNEDHIENKMDAVGDIVIYLIDYCNTEGFDFSDILYGTWDSVQQRDWNSNSETGDHEL